MDQESRRQFSRRVRRAAADRTLGEAFRRASETYEQQRAATFADFDFAGLREQVKEVKQRALDQLPELFERFRQEAEQVGCRVVLADDAAAARDYVVNLARERGVQLVVKSKSMATEEIALNPALEAAGVTTVETDLGEWIVQLAGERPSHFVTPAMHKTREQVARLFSRHAGRRLSPDIEGLVRYAREALRPSFIEAGLGITGANLAIAESGTLVICTNEGNARLVSSLPPIHVCVVGIDKLVPALEDTVPILKMLGRSASGQKLTAYTSFITGPSRTADIEKQLALGVHGPLELHIVFLDNGREALRQDPELREALNCIRCSACLNMCPAFRVVSGHVFGRTYHGAIGCVLTAALEGLEAAEHITEVCTGCRFCVDVCPAGVDGPKLVRIVKERMAAGRRAPVASRAAGWVLSHPASLRRAAAAGGLGQRILGPLVRAASHLPLQAAAPLRAAPQLAAVPLPEVWVKREVGEPAVLYPGCLATFAYPEIGMAAGMLLEAAGLAPVLAADSGCCGMPSIHLLDLPAARRMAAQTVEALAATTGPIITVCPTCSVALRQEHPRLLADTPLAETAAEVAARARELSECLVARGYQQPPLERAQGVTVAHHLSCHLKRSLGVDDQPRQLLAAAGYTLADLAEADRCCGFAGTYAVRLEPVSLRILQRKMECLAAAKPDVIATDCPGCLLHLRRGAARFHLAAPISHTACLLADPKGGGPP